MKLLIHGRNLELTPALREYTQSKLERAIQHYDDMVKEADVHLSVARNPRGGCRKASRGEMSHVLKKEKSKSEYLE